jgi:hypothetical protein
MGQCQSNQRPRRRLDVDNAESEAAMKFSAAHPILSKLPDVTETSEISYTHTEFDDSTLPTSPDSFLSLGATHSVPCSEENAKKKSSPLYTSTLLD